MRISGGHRDCVAALACAALLLVAGCTTREIVGIEIGEVEMFPGTASLVDGQTLQFTATVSDAEGQLLPGASVDWESDDPGVASIDEDGLLLAVHEGAVTIRATFRDAYGTAAVAVLPAAAIVLSEDSVAFKAVAGGSSPQPVVIQVLNSGVGTIGSLEASVEYPTGQPSGWLTPTLAGTEAPTSLTLTAETGTLPGGAYDATVVLDSDLDADPTSISVSLALAGIDVAETGGSTSVTEAGSSDSLMVVLAAEPASNVVLEVVSADPTETVAGPAQLLFTPSTWDVPQTVTVIGVDDVVLDGDVTTSIAVGVVDVLSDPSFAAIPDAVVPVVTLDDEVAGFTVVQSGGSTIIAQGGSDDFTIVLDVEPVSDVVINVVSQDPSEVVVSPTSLTFTPGDWSTPQTVVVTGAEEKVWGGVQVTGVTLSVDDALSDDGFDEVPDQVVTVIAVSGVSVTETGGSTVVTEAGSTDRIFVVLESAPASNVVVEVLSGDETEATVEPARLTFTPSTWNVQQSATVTGVDDSVLDGDLTTSIAVGVVESLSDPAFALVPDKIVEASTLDDEIAGFSVVESGGATVLVQGGTDDFTVVLDVEPVSQVVVDVVSSHPGLVSVSTPALTFTPQNWSVPQVVVLTGSDGDNWGGAQNVDVTLSVNDELSDDGFDPLPDQIVPVLLLTGFVITESDGSTVVTEDETKDVFTVQLDGPPTGDVLVTVVSGDLTEATVKPTELTFGPDSWNEPQEVTVTGVDDPTVDGDTTTPVTVSVLSAGGDPGLTGLPDATVLVTTLDDDVASFQVRESGGETKVGIGEIDAVRVRLGAQPLSDVVIRASISHPSLVAFTPASLTFTPENWSERQSVFVAGLGGDAWGEIEEVFLTLSVDPELSDDAFDDLPDQVVTVELKD